MSPQNLMTTPRSQLTDAESSYIARQDAWCRSVARRMDAYLADTYGTRRDTNTALFTRSLAKILAMPFDRRHPALNMMDILPSAPAVDMGAASVISRGHDIIGQAEVAVSYDTEIPTVTIQGRENEIKMFPALAKFPLFYQDMMQAAFGGVALQAKMAAAAYRVIREAIDLALAFGNASAGFNGAWNNSDTAGAALARVLQGAVTAGITGAWSAIATTDANIINDVRQAIDTIEADGLYNVDAIAVGPLEYGRLAQPTTALGYAPNLLSVIQASFGVVIHKSQRLAAIPAADAAGGVSCARAVFFERSVEVFNPLVTMGPEQYPPKVGDIGYEITVHQRTGGVESTNPLGAIYLDMV